MENVGNFRNGNLERELTTLQSKMDQRMSELEVCSGMIYGPVYFAPSIHLDGVPI